MDLPLGGRLFSDQGALLSLLGGLEFGRTGEVCLGLGGGRFRCEGFIIPLDGAKAFWGWDIPGNVPPLQFTRAIWYNTRVLLMR